MQQSTNYTEGFNAAGGQRYGAGTGGQAGGTQSGGMQTGSAQQRQGMGITGMSAASGAAGLTGANVSAGIAEPGGMAGSAGTPGATGMAAAGYGFGGSVQTPLQPNSQQLSYEQFQEQVRQRQEQEQELARLALVNAGADRHSDKIRSVIQHLQGLGSEIQMAENQIQVQMDAQLRQVQLIRQRVLQAENMMQQLLNGSASIRQ